MNFNKTLSTLLYVLKPEQQEMMHSKLCGVPLLAYNETIRHTVDQDNTWFFYLVKYHDVILDIGANIGYTALLAMIQNPNRPYVLVDSNPKALAI